MQRKFGRKKIVPVKIIGKMTLNRNVDNLFAETEQAAFHPGMLCQELILQMIHFYKGDYFLILDTQLIRLGGPNFHEIPINDQYVLFITIKEMVITDKQSI